MKLRMEEGRKQMEAERVKLGLELYTGDVEARYAGGDVGATLDELDRHTTEFTRTLADMFEKLRDEKKILEGTAVPKYDPTVPTGGPITTNVVPRGYRPTGPMPGEQWAPVEGPDAAKIAWAKYNARREEEAARFQNRFSVGNGT